MYNIPFDKIDKTEFLTNYWQKAPCLFKGAFANPPNALSADELAGLSLEEDVESRLIINSDKKWTVEHGPFEASRFQRLPENNWTLLVQSVDHWHSAVRQLLTHFAFIPRWRYDDIMISFATDGGGVGPHADNYDVFLLQSQGERRWRVGTKGQTGCKPGGDAQSNDGMCLLGEFSASIDYLMQPGDMLYIPPDTPHWGVSVGESIGYSVGYRTMQAHQLLALLTEQASENNCFNQFFADAYRSSVNHSNHLDHQMIEWAQLELRKLADKPDQIARLLSQQLSLSKLDVALEVEGDTLQDNSDMIQEITKHSSIKLEEQVCVNWIRMKNKILLNIEGERFEFEAKDENAISKLASYQTIPINLFNCNLINYPDELFDFPDVLTNLIDRGYIKLVREK